MEPDIEELKRLGLRGGVMCRIGRVAYGSERFSLYRRPNTVELDLGDEKVTLCYDTCWDCSNRVEWREFDEEGNVHCRNITNDRYYAAKEKTRQRISGLEQKLRR